MAINPSIIEARRILGIGIVLTGLVILAIGLILGLELPNYMREKRLSRLCITSTQSYDYEDWINDGNRTRINYLYIWNLTNSVNVLSKNEIPKFQLIGPYAFRQIEKKVKVEFYDKLIHYKSLKQQQFDAQLTERMCPNCSLYDRIIIINPAFLQLIEVFEDPLYFYLLFLPEMLNKASKRSAHHFDNWIEKRDSDFKKIIIDHNRNGNVSPSVYLNLNGTIGNSTIFGSFILRQRDQWNNCVKNYRQLFISVNFNLSEVIKVNTTYNIINTISRILNDSNANNIRWTDKSGLFELKCGLVFYLIQLAATSLVNWMIIKPILSSFLCQQNECFLDDTFTPNSYNIATAYVTAIVNYTIYYLPRVLQMQQSKSIAITKSDVKSAALGYFVDGEGLLMVNVTANNYTEENVTNLYYVKGFLEHYMTENEAPKITLKTCLLNRSRDDNLNYKALEDLERQRRQININDENASNLNIDGYQDYKIPPSNRIFPCGISQPFYKHFKIYLPQLWRSVTFSLFGITEYQSVTLQRFCIQTNKLEKNWSMSDVTGYSSWIAPADQLPYNLNKTQIWNKTISEVLVEAVTGKIWVVVTNFDFYVGLRKQLYNSSFEISNLIEKPLPHYRLYSTLEPSSMTVNLYKSEIGIMLQTSCGGLIGLSIVGSVIILTGIGVAIVVVDRPPHRVSPIYQNNYIASNSNSEISIIS